MEEGLSMNIPDLNRIVDTYIPIPPQTKRDAYLQQLRDDLLPHITKLQGEELLDWYSFLIHPANQLDRPTVSSGDHIHLRLEPKKCMGIEEFVKELPDHFEDPKPVTVYEGRAHCPKYNPDRVRLDKEIAGIDVSILRCQKWEYAWELLGEASEWILSLLERHDDKAMIPIEHIVQFLHFATNPLMLGMECCWMPGCLKF